MAAARRRCPNPVIPPSSREGEAVLHSGCVILPPIMLPRCAYMQCRLLVIYRECGKDRFGPVKTVVRCGQAAIDSVCNRAPVSARVTSCAMRLEQEIYRGAKTVN